MAMKIKLSMHFTKSAEAKVPAGLSLQQLRDEDLVPVVGDDIAVTGTSETAVFRVIRRQVEYQSGVTMVSIVLDIPPADVTFIPAPRGSSLFR